MTPTPPHPIGTLVVTSAVHGEVRVPLLPGSFSVGRAITCDLVLADPSLGTTHFRLHMTSAIALEAVDHAVMLAGTGEIAPGQTRSILQSAGFSAGSVQMRLELATTVAASPLPNGKPARQPAPLWLRAAAAVVLLAFAGSAAAYAFGGRAPPQAALAPPLAAPAIDVARREPALLPDLQALQAELDARRLGTVRIEALADGSFRATGSLTPQEAAAWRDAARWLDAASAGQIVLIDRVAVASPAPPLAVQSAWVGARPYVIDGAGQKLFVGAVVANGWTIEGIEAGRVSLRRQGQRLAVTF